jgi:SP family sugar:H+ symporter-like MFS transporter
MRSPVPATNLLYVTLIAGAAALGGFLFGFDSAVINGAVSGIQAGFRSSSVGTGFAVASILLGCAVGAVVAGPLADRFGRRPVMIVTAVIFAVTAVWAGLAGTSAMFTLARFLSGIGVGAASVVCPAYIAESSPAQIRGRLASLQQLGIVVGIFVALFSDQLLAKLAGGVSSPLGWSLAAWRWMFLVEVIPAILFGVAILAAPESLRFLVAAGREAQALKVLQHIEPGATEQRIEEIRRTLLTDGRMRLLDLQGATGKILPIVWIGIGLSALQQLVGINSVFYYGATLWQAVGFTSADALAINVVTGVVNIVSTLVAMAFVDRVGRRPLLLWGSAGMAVTLGVLVAAFSTATVGAGGHVALSPHAGIIALVAANLYVFAFGVSWGPCVWILLGEMFPNRIRGTALAVAVFAQWMANWAVTLSFPPIVSSLGPVGAYGIYCFFAVVSFIFVRRGVRETRGRELEEM